MSAIRYRLKEIMKANKVSAPKLAMRSGIPLGSIKSILNGLSKNPRASTLEALAKAFDCDIAILLSENAVVQQQPSVQTIAIEDSLFKDAIEKVEEISRSKGISLEGQDELKKRCVTRIYQYAMERNKGKFTAPKIDNVYAEWVVEREVEL